MATYTISKSEQETVGGLTVEAANLADADWSSLGEGPHVPVQPTQVRRLSGGWAGAEWVRVVADYQDHPSVGYESLAALGEDHGWTTDVDPQFEAA